MTEIVPLSFNEEPTQEPEATLSFQGTGRPQLPEKEAQNRAAKMDFALGEKSPGVDALASSLKAGAEEEVRNQYAGTAALDFERQKYNMVHEYAKRKAAEGKPISPDEIRFFQDMTRKDYAEYHFDPDTFMETEYAKKYLGKFLETRKDDPSSVITQAQKENPEAFDGVKKTAEEMMARKQLFNSLAEDTRAKYSGQGVFSKASDWVEQFIPLLSQYHQRTGRSDAFLTGTNKEETYASIVALPPQEAYKAAKEIVEQIFEANGLDAQQWIEGLIHYSSSDAAFDNVTTFADVGDVVGAGAVGTALKVGKRVVNTGRVATEATKGAVIAGKAVKAAAKEGAVEASESPLQAAKQVFKQVVHANASKAPELDAILSIGGKLDQAGMEAARKGLIRKFNKIDPLQDGINLRASVPMIMNPQGVAGDVGSFGREFGQRLMSKMLRSADYLTDMLDLGKVDRLSPQALEAALARAKADLVERNPSINGAVVQIDRHLAEDNAAGTNALEFVIGRPDATAFESPVQAQGYAKSTYGLPDGSYRLSAQGEYGDGYYIKLRKDVNETSDEVRDALVLDKDRQSNKGIINTLFGSLRSAEDLLSADQRANRHIATHGAQELQTLARQAAAPLLELMKPGKKNAAMRERLQRVLEHNRDFETPDPADPTKTVRGQFYQTIGEFEKAYRDLNKGVAPTEKEVAAYFNYQQLNEQDFIIRNLGIYRDKVRQGAEKITSLFHAPDGGVMPVSMEGVVKKEVPWTAKDDATVFFQGANGEANLVRLQGSTAERKAQIDDMLKNQGYKVVQVFDPLSKPLAKVAGTEEPIHYMLVKDFEVSRLDWKQLPYRPGGHVVYQHEWFVKQPKIRRANGYHSENDTRHIYEGDVSILNVATEAEAKKFASAMDEARIMMNNGDPRLKEFLDKNLPFDEVSFRKMFTAFEDPKTGETRPPRLHPADKISYTSNGRNLSDIMGEDLRRTYTSRDEWTYEDNIRNGHNLMANVNKKFAGQRDPDLDHYRTTGVADAPMYTVDKPHLLDPYTVINHSLGNIIRSRLMDDYKIAAVEDWMQEFQGVMKTDLDELRRDPIWYLHNPEWDTTTRNRDALKAAKNARQAIINFLGTESELRKDVDWLSSKLHDAVFEKMGKGASDYLSESKLFSSKDPVAFVRSMAFHLHLGIFSPLQLIQQAQGWFHIAALSPTNVLPGTSGMALMMRMGLTKDKDIINKFADMASNLGWSKEDFLESYNALRATGWYHVEGENAWHNNITNPKVIQTNAGKFFDAGTVFFKQAERMIRLTSWNAAYLEWKKANPGAILRNSDRNAVLRRAQELGVNMTRASNANWQKGLASIPTQFLSYQIRLMEQFLGGRLSTAEKVRAFAMYSAMYGIPVAGAAVTGIPFYEGIRQSALENGVNTDNVFWSSAIEGLIPTFMNYMTGSDKNYAQRLGPGGLRIIQEFINGDKSALELAMGPAGSTVAQALGSTYTALGGLVRAFDPSDSEERWSPKPEDLLALGKNISSFDYATRLIMAINYGRYYTKNGQYLGDVTPMDAVIHAVTGLQPMEFTDAQLMMASMADQKKAQDEAKKAIADQYRRAFEAARKGDTDTADSYIRRAKVLTTGAGFRPDQVPGLIKEVTRDLLPIIENVPNAFWRKSTIDQLEGRKKEWLRKQEENN